eukprot:scaffold10531_cov37-Tisochrysis_lutea.AAC.2
MGASSLRTCDGGGRAGDVGRTLSRTVTDAAYETVQQVVGTHHSSFGSNCTSSLSTTIWKVLPTPPERANHSARGGRWPHT